MNAPVNVPAPRKEPTPIDLLKSTVARRADDFKMVLPSHISVDKFQRTIATAALSNPTLLQCDRQSLLIAAMKLAQDGLLPDGREAALVPFKSRVKVGEGRNDWADKWQVQPMPMAFGLRKKILQSGMVVSLETGLVYRAELESGHFIYEIGMDPPIRHRPKLDLTTEETADEHIVAAYSIARIKPDSDGAPYWSVEVMRRSEIDKVRQASQTGAVGKADRNGKAIQPKGPWVDWYGEMARKTVLRRHSKVLPMSGDILDTIDRDRDEEITADSAAALLSVEPNAPLVLPQHDGEAGTLIENQSGTEAGIQIDGATGEVLSSSPTGMTEVDEATARALDAGEAEPEPESEDRAQAREWVEGLEKAFAAAKSDADRRQVHTANAETISRLEDYYPDLHERAMQAIPAYEEQEGTPAAADADAGSTADVPLDPYRGKPWAEKRREFLDRLAEAETKDQIEAVDADATRIFIQFPDEVQDEIEAALGAARKRLRNKVA